MRMMQLSPGVVVEVMMVGEDGGGGLCDGAGGGDDLVNCGVRLAFERVLQHRNELVEAFTGWNA